MPYDPRMLQMAQMGIGMMSPDQRAAFADPRSQQPQPQQPKQWWEQAVQVGQPANQSENMPDDRSDYERKQPPSLLQLLMLGGQPTYSGKPTGGANPWGWMGGLGMPGGGGRPR